MLITETKDISDADRERRKEHMKNYYCHFIKNLLH